MNATVNAIVNANGNVNRSIRLFSQSNKLKCAAVFYLTGSFSSAHEKGVSERVRGEAESKSNHFR